MHESPDRERDGDADEDDALLEEAFDELPGEAGTDTPIEEDEEDREERGGETPSQPGAATGSAPGAASKAGEGGKARPLPVKKAPGFTIVDGNSIARTPGRGFTGGWWRVWTMLAAVAAVVLLRRRMAPFVLLGFIATVLAVMLVPPLCTKALKVLGSLWMLERFETLADVLWIPLSAPAAAAVLEPLLRWRWIQSPLSLLAIPIALQHGHYAKPYDWETYLERAEAPADQRFGREFRHMARLQVALRRAIPAGATVLVDPTLADRLTMLHDMRIVASQRSSTGVPFMRKRTTEVQLMLDGKTRESLREELIASHGIGHLIERGALRGWVELWSRDRARWGGYVFVELASEPDWNRVAWKRLRDAERLMRRGRHQTARPMLEAALAEIADDEPGADLAWFRLGNARLWTGDPEAAIDAYDRAIAILRRGPALRTHARQRPRRRRRHRGVDSPLRGRGATGARRGGPRTRRKRMVQPRQLLFQARAMERGRGGLRRVAPAAAHASAGAVLETRGGSRDAARGVSVIGVEPRRCRRIARGDRERKTPRAACRGSMPHRRMIEPPARQRSGTAGRPARDGEHTPSRRPVP